jgi:MFS family permease
VAQFAALNAVWAATIVMAEVPSGALADVVGRRRLLRFAALSMLVEMALLCLAPRGHTTLLFAFFLVNRVLSGLAEAAASGADEAIAYDALQAAGIEGQWGQVLDVQMRLQSVMFIFTMTLGAAVYDPELMTRAAALLGWGRPFTQGETLRFPLYLTFVMALFTLVAVWGMDEVCPHPGANGTGRRMAKASAVEAFRLTFDTGRWILKAPFVLAVICFGMLFDSILRMVVTLASQYYRMVALPESTFGILGSVMALAGVFIPRLALRVAADRSPAFCLATTAATALAGLAGMTFFWPYAGLVPALVAFSGMYLTGFYVSYFVNQKVPSARRATVLSFKGLAYNLAYGFIGVVYAALLEVEKAGIDHAHRTAQAVENLVFKDTFFWFPLLLAAGLAVTVMVFRRRIDGTGGGR